MAAHPPATAGGTDPSESASAPLAVAGADHVDVHNKSTRYLEEVSTTCGSGWVRQRRTSLLTFEALRGGYS